MAEPAPHYTGEKVLEFVTNVINNMPPWPGVESREYKDGRILIFCQNASEQSMISEILTSGLPDIVVTKWSTADPWDEKANISVKVVLSTWPIKLKVSQMPFAICAILNQATGTQKHVWKVHPQ